MDGHIVELLSAGIILVVARRVSKVGSGLLLNFGQGASIGVAPVTGGDSTRHRKGGAGQ